MLVGGAVVAAGAPRQASAGLSVVDVRGRAVIAASAGRPMQVPEPTYRWHGLTVPVGACGAIVGGRAMVLPCGDKRVVAYRRAAAARDRGFAAAAVAAILAGGAVIFFWRWRSRQPLFHAERGAS